MDKERMQENLSKLSEVQRVVVGDRVYVLRYVSCRSARCKRCVGGPAHGPYWYMLVHGFGRRLTVYIGRNLDTTKYVTDGGNFDAMRWADDRARKRHEATIRNVGGTPTNN